MDQPDLEADYVVIGAGAVAMAFADTLLSESDASLLIVDRRHRPGGHWNDAYPFVRLHQPSAFYGVNSRELGSGRKDSHGPNEGMYELASGAEVCSYFDQLMRERLLPSVRVQYLPKHEYSPDGYVTSLLTGARRRVRARRRIVDATPLETAVPATHPPAYEVAPGVECVPVNELARVDRPRSGFVIIGSGKTGIDACLWLLEAGADPDAIHWVMPRDPWLLNRRNFQPGEESAAQVFGSQAAQMEAAARAESVDDLLQRLGAADILLRIDPIRRPEVYRCATVTQAELTALRRIRNVIRLGYVQRIERGRLVLDRGGVDTGPDWLFVDCSTQGLRRWPIVPVFADGRITVQVVRACQPAFSAAFIAHVEASYADDAEKNRLCTVVPLPDRAEDWVRTQLADLGNRAAWSADKGLTDWLARSRLDRFTAMRRQVGAGDTAVQTHLQRIRDATRPALANLRKLLGQMPANGGRPLG